MALITQYTEEAKEEAPVSAAPAPVTREGPENEEEEPQEPGVKILSKKEKEKLKKEREKVCQIFC